MAPGVRGFTSLLRQASGGPSHPCLVITMKPLRGWPPAAAINAVDQRHPDLTQISATSETCSLGEPVIFRGKVTTSAHVISN